MPRILSNMHVDPNIVNYYLLNMHFGQWKVGFWKEWIDPGTNNRSSQFVLQVSKLIRFGFIFETCCFNFLSVLNGTQSKFLILNQQCFMIQNVTNVWSLLSFNLVLFAWDNIIHLATLYLPIMTLVLYILQSNMQVLLTLDRLWF